MTVRFGVLGDVEARVGGRLIELGPARQRCVLAALLIDANQPMPVDQLADRVWGQHPPQRSLETLYSYLSRLRTVLADVADAHLSRRSGGYVLGVEADAVDLYRFRHLAAEARAADHETRAPALLRDALDLWRGTALRSLDTPWANAMLAEAQPQIGQVPFGRDPFGLQGIARGVCPGRVQAAQCRAAPEIEGIAE